MANLSLDMPTLEVLKLNNNICGIDQEIIAYLNDITTSCDELSNVVRSNEVWKKVLHISDNILKIKECFSNNMDSIDSFLRAQINNYEVTVEDAVKGLREALAFISENFPIEV